MLAFICKVGEAARAVTAIAVAGVLFLLLSILVVEIGNVPEAVDSLS